MFIKITFTPKIDITAPPEMHIETDAPNEVLALAMLNDGIGFILRQKIQQAQAEEAMKQAQQTLAPVAQGIPRFKPNHANRFKNKH